MSLPDAAVLANLVTNVTLPMCATSFVVAANEGLRGPSICGRMVLLPVRGARDISFVLSTDTTGARALACALFGCPAGQVDSRMANDAISEILNMVAGQYTATMKVEQALGLPRPITLAELAAEEGVGFDDAVLLVSEGPIQLKLWIFEKTAATAQTDVPTRPTLVRSLIRKLRLGT